MKLILAKLLGLLPAGWKKYLIHSFCEWAVKSTKTKLDDKLWASVKDKI
jgi:hypothetical protein